MSKDTLSQFSSSLQADVAMLHIFFLYDIIMWDVSRWCRHAQNNAFHCLTFCEEWKNKRMNVICTIDVYKRAYPRLSIPLHVLCRLQSSTHHKGAACVLFLVLMLTLKGNTAVYKWKICGSALFSGLTDHSVPLLPAIGLCYLIHRNKAGHCGPGIAS